MDIYAIKLQYYVLRKKPVLRVINIDPHYHQTVKKAILTLVKVN